MFTDLETALPIHLMPDRLVYTIPFHHVTMSKVDMKTVQTEKYLLCLDRKALCVAMCILVSSQFQKGSYLMHAGTLLWNSASRKSCEGSSERSTEESGSKTIVLLSSNEKRQEMRLSIHSNSKLFLIVNQEKLSPSALALDGAPVQAKANIIIIS